MSVIKMSGLKVHLLLLQGACDSTSSEHSNDHVLPLQLERELAGMRNSGVDLRAKQAEIDAARRRAAEAQEALVAAQRCALHALAHVT